MNKFDFALKYNLCLIYLPSPEHQKDVRLDEALGDVV